VNEYLCRKTQNLALLINEVRDDIDAIRTDFDKLKEFTEHQILHIESKVDQFIAYQEKERKTFNAELMNKMETMEKKIHD
jgi:hypothetical protein